MVNACVTGILPGFRYVLLTDALIESLTPLEIAAVFGHEIGHIAHRHLLYFGFFFMGSLGVLTVLGEIVARCGPWFEQLAWLTPWTPAIVSEVVQGIALLCVLGLYFWIVFGQLSRRFERQADVFGSKVVSCDLADCPPHHDLDHDLSPDPFAVKSRCSARSESGFSPTPSRMSRGVTAWTPPDDRGGTAASPTESRSSKDSSGIPDREDRFQRGVTRLRIGLGVVLVMAILLSFVTQLDLIRCIAPECMQALSSIVPSSLVGQSGIVPSSDLAWVPREAGALHTRLVPTTRRSSCPDGPFGSS